MCKLQLSPKIADEHLVQQRLADRIGQVRLEGVLGVRLDRDETAARRTRTIIMFLGPLMHEFDEFLLPYAGGCDLGTRTGQPHMQALRQFGLSVEATAGFYTVQAPALDSYDRSFVLTERGIPFRTLDDIADGRRPGGHRAAL